MFLDKTPTDKRLAMSVRCLVGVGIKWKLPDQLLDIVCAYIGGMQVLSIPRRPWCFSVDKHGLLYLLHEGQGFGSLLNAMMSVYRVNQDPITNAYTTETVRTWHYIGSYVGAIAIAAGAATETTMTTNPTLTAPAFVFASGSVPPQQDGTETDVKSNGTDHDSTCNHVSSLEGSDSNSVSHNDVVVALAQSQTVIHILNAETGVLVRSWNQEPFDLWDTSSLAIDAEGYVWLCNLHTDGYSEVLMYSIQGRLLSRICCDRLTQHGRYAFIAVPPQPSSYIYLSVLEERSSLFGESCQSCRADGTGFASSTGVLEQVSDVTTNNRLSYIRQLDKATSRVICELPAYGRLSFDAQGRAYVHDQQMAIKTLRLRDGDLRTAFETSAREGFDLNYPYSRVFCMDTTPSRCLCYISDGYSVRVWDVC